MNRLKALTLLFILTIAFTAKSQATTLPVSIHKTHTDHFEGSKILDWTLNKVDNEQLYLVEFRIDNQTHEAYYQPSGELVSHLTYVQDIPNDLRVYLEGKFPDAEVTRLVIRRQFESGEMRSELFTVLLKTAMGTSPVSLQYLEGSDSLTLVAER